MQPFGDFSPLTQRGTNSTGALRADLGPTSSHPNTPTRCMPCSIQTVVSFAARSTS